MDRALKLDQFWPYLVTVLADRIARRTTRIVKEKGLNLSQWRVLVAVAEVPGRTAGDVVTITPMDKGIVSRATRALLEMNLMRREASQRDGRISHLHLTEQGRALYEALVPDVEAVCQPSEIDLTEEQQSRLSEDLKRLIDAIPDQR